MNSLILSAALDTNGQNQRYVRASQRWGDNPDVLKVLALGQYDPAAVVARYQVAADKTSELRIRSAHRSQHMYQSMPADIIWNRQTTPLVKQLAEEADLVHLNNSWRPWQLLGLRERKPFLLHHHGTLMRLDPKRMLSEARNMGATQAVSTVDLMRYAPELLHWLPTAYHVDWLRDFGAEHRSKPGGPVRIVSAPTNRDVKSTALLEATVARLIDEGLDIELVLVEERPWLECMAIKATADIYFDQLHLGYGCNAVEAWGMGIPVIAGADDWTTAKMTAMWGGLPFLPSSEETLGDAIVALAERKALRTKWAKKGMAHIRRYHDEKPALTRLAELYHLTLTTTPPERLAPVTVSFTAKATQLNIANRYLNFPLTTDNPYLVTRIRVYAARFPHHGIEEVTA